MPRQTWLADVVADAFRGQKGFRVDTYNGWQNRGSTSFSPVGVMNHHTGPGGYDNLLSYMAVGPVHPPLCNIATSRPINGIVRITIVAAGRANHAGAGHLSWTGTNNGNFRTIGIENQNDGRQSWPSQQTEGIRILSAALLNRLGVGTSRMVEHKTYAPTRKVDRHSINLSTERAATQKIMSGGLKPADPWEEYYMSLSNSDKKKMDKLMGLSAGQIDNLVETGSTFGSAKLRDLDRFVTQLRSEGVDGQSFARQFLLFHRNERPTLQAIMEHIEAKGTSVRGFVRGATNIFRYARDEKDWPLDTQ